MSDDSEDRKHQPHEEHENHERWLVSYADFITLLFAFFVVMYATSNNNQEKQKSFEQSVRVNLKLDGAGGSGEGSGAQEGNVGGQASGDTLIAIEGFPSRGGPGEVTDYLAGVIENKMNKDEKEKIQELRHDAMGVRIALASAQFFLPGGTKIRTSALQALDKIAEIFKQTDKKIIVEGHTDNTPVGQNAAYESNWELASLRATSIVRYLVKYHKIDPSRLSATSFADTRPIDNNNTAEGRARNRRIELYLVLNEKL